MQCGDKVYFVLAAYVFRCERRRIERIEMSKWYLGGDVHEGWRRNAVGQQRNRKNLGKQAGQSKREQGFRRGKGF
jgi:hypothetical protein